MFQTNQVELAISNGGRMHGHCFFQRFQLLEYWLKYSKNPLIMIVGEFLTVSQVMFILTVDPFFVPFYLFQL